MTPFYSFHVMFCFHIGSSGVKCVCSFENGSGTKEPSHEKPERHKTVVAHFLRPSPLFGMTLGSRLVFGVGVMCCGTLEFSFVSCSPSHSGRGRVKSDKSFRKRVGHERVRTDEKAEKTENGVTQFLHLSDFST